MDGVEDEKVVATGDLVNRLQHLHQTGARYHDVVEVVVGGDLSDGAEGGLSRLPQELPLNLIGGDADVECPVALGGGDDHIGLGDDSSRMTVDLGEEHRGGVHGQAGVDEVLHGADQRPIHHLQRRRHHTGGDHIRHRCGCARHLGETEQHRAHRRRNRKQAHQYSSDHPERSL